MHVRPAEPAEIERLADLENLRVVGPVFEPAGLCLVRGDELCQL